MSLVRPDWGADVFEQRQAAPLDVQGRINLQGNRHPYRLVLLVDDRERPEPVEIDKAAETLKARVKLGPGPHRLRFQASNEWGKPVFSQESLVHYRRPPEILELKLLTGAGKPVVDLEARVHSPIPLLNETVTVEVNGEKSWTARLAPIKAVGPGLYTLRVEEVSLAGDRTDHRIHLEVGNAEAKSRGASPSR